MKFKPVELTDKALEKVKEIMDKKSVGEDYALRIGVRGGAACMGVSYMLGFDKPKSEDMLYDIGKVRVAVEKKQVMFLTGLKVDWVEKDGEAGFAFSKEDQ